MLDVGRNLTYQLTHQLGAAIIQGQYSPTKSFPTEAELSKQFNISRSVTREAVKMLTAKGLIASRPRQGIRVMPSTAWNMFDADILAWTLQARPSIELLREFTQLRIAIEPEAAKLAAANANHSESVSKLEQALVRLHAGGAAQDDKLEAVIEFHCAMLSATDNRFFIQLREFMPVALSITSTCSKQLKGSFEVNYDEYQKIFTAIKQGQSEKASIAVMELLARAQTLIVDSATPRA